MATHKTIRVSIHGREYPLRVAEADEAFTRRVASLVDSRVREIVRDVPGHPDLTHTVLAALSLGEELLSAQEALQRLQPLAAEADQLARLLEEALEAPAGDGAPPTHPGHEAGAATATDTRSEDEPPGTSAEPAEGASEGAGVGFNQTENSPRNP